MKGLASMNSYEPFSHTIREDSDSFVFIGKSIHNPSSRGKLFINCSLNWVKSLDLGLMGVKIQRFKARLPGWLCSQNRGEALDLFSIHYPWGVAILTWKLTPLVISEKCNLFIFNRL